jgi:hypothetical protein
MGEVGQVPIVRSRKTTTRKAPKTVKQTIIYDAKRQAEENPTGALLMAGGFAAAVVGVVIGISSVSKSAKTA